MTVVAEDGGGWDVAGGVHGLSCSVLRFCVVVNVRFSVVGAPVAGRQSLVQMLFKPCRTERACVTQRPAKRGYGGGKKVSDLREFGASAFPVMQRSEEPTGH